MKKGQMALEFLMTYGWAILSAIIVIGVLAYFGVFSPKNYQHQDLTNYTCLSKSLCEQEGLNYSTYSFMNSGDIWCKKYIMQDISWDIDFRVGNNGWKQLQIKFPNC